MKRLLTLLLIIFFGSASVGAVAVPVDPFLAYSILQALGSALGVELVSTSSPSQMEEYANSYLNTSSVPSSVDLRSEALENGDVETWLFLNKADFDVWASVLGSFLLGGLDVSDLATTGTTAAVSSPVVANVGSEVYDSQGNYYELASALFPAASVTSGTVYLSQLGTPLFSMKKNITSPFTLYFSDSEIYYYLPDNSRNMRYYDVNDPDSVAGSFTITNQAHNTGAIYLAFDAVTSQLLLLYSYNDNTFSFLRATNGRNSGLAFVDVVAIGSTISATAPSGLSIDTPTNTWDTLNDDAGYYLKLGTDVALTADSVADSISSALSDAGTLSYEGTYADSLEDASTALEDTTVDPDVPSPNPPSIPSGLPALGALLVTKFPFSIPWDFSRVFSLLVSEPDTPYYQFNLMPFLQRFGISASLTTVTLDFSSYELVGRVIRWALYITFAISLILLTKRLVWSA